MKLPWPLLLLFLAAWSMTGGCGGGERLTVEESIEGADRVYTLRCLMTGYYGLGGDIDGQRNPVLTAREGETVAIVIINGERMVHDIIMRYHRVASDKIFAEGEKTVITFEARRDDTYYCGIPGHIETGMIGEFKILTQPGPL